MREEQSQMHKHDAEQVEQQWLAGIRGWVRLGDAEPGLWAALAPASSVDAGTIRVLLDERDGYLRLLTLKTDRKPAASIELSADDMDDLCLQWLAHRMPKRASGE
jgi:hypothetical protein